MNVTTTRELTLDLVGLDGANPLAFLAALGTLRTLTLAWPRRQVRMSWKVYAGAWRPVLHITHEQSAESLATSIADALPPFETLLDPKLLQESQAAGPKNKQGKPKWQDKLRFPHRTYRRYVERLSKQATQQQRLALDFASAWASEAEVEVVEKNDVARRTRFDFTAGNQAFVAMARDLWRGATSEDIYDALFQPWQYTSDGTSLRWDPLDEGRRYALHAADPQNSSKNPILSVSAANSLALMALPLFPLIPSRAHAEQPGFARIDKERTFTWPIWSCRLTQLSIGSLLVLDELTKPAPSSALTERGIAAVYRSRIVLPSDRYRNFTPSASVL